MCFGCPYEGAVAAERVFAIAERLVAAGAAGDRLRRHDGHGEPGAGREFFDGRARAPGDDVELTAHFHNTRGQGLANVLAALEAGCASFESSFGELGGCPVPPGATGNVATEDLVSMLHEMGIATGDRPRRAARLRTRAQREVLGRAARLAHARRAGPVDWHRTDARAAS